MSKAREIAEERFARGDITSSELQNIINTLNGGIADEMPLSPDDPKAPENSDINHSDGFIGEDLLKDQPFEYIQTALPTSIILNKSLEDERDGVLIKTFTSESEIRFFYAPKPHYTFSRMINFEFSILWDPRENDGSGVKEQLLRYQIVDASDSHRTGRGATGGSFAVINLFLLNSERIAIGTPMSRFGLYEHGCGGFGGEKHHPPGWERESRSIRDHAKWRRDIPSSFEFVEFIELNVSHRSWVRGCYI